MTSCTVSVLMTVFNTKAYLGAAIDSILSQTLERFELIVIDDGSTDGSWEVIADAAARDRRVHPLRRASRGGASAGLNLGLAHATGQYLTRQDSDDLSRPTRLAEQVAFLERHPAVGAVGTAVTIIDPEGRARGDCFLKTTNEDIQAALLDRMCLGPHILIRREAFERAGLRFDESLSGSEDYDLCLRLSEVASLASLEAPLYLYRHHASSVSHGQRYLQLFRKARALELAMQRRHGPAPSPAHLRHAGRDYLRAAVLAHAANASTDARDYAARAAALVPGLLSDPVGLEPVVRTCTTDLPTAAALRFIESLFDEVLPWRTRALSRLRRRLVADAHMKAVFAAADNGRADSVGRNLWPAIRSNPAWLANAGVLSLIARRAFARTGRPARSRP